MRRNSSLVMLVSVLFSVSVVFGAAAAPVRADDGFFSLPAQPISLILEPRPSQEKDVIDLTGNWQGYASVGRKNVNYEWQISQEGERVFGTIFISTLEGLDKSSHEFEGTFDNSVLNFRAVRWLSPQLSTWCMAAGKLKLDNRSSPPELRGTWGPNPIPGGCPAGAHGRVQLIRR